MTSTSQKKRLVVSSTITVEQFREIAKQPQKKPPVTTLTAKQYRADHVDQIEHTIQKTCIQWFDLQYPGLLLYAIPNGGHRHIVTARKLKAEGVRRGIPDLKLAVVTTSYPGLYIETKTPKSDLSDDQIIAHAYLRAQGYLVAVVRSLEEFQRVVNEYLSGRDI